MYLIKDTTVAYVWPVKTSGLSWASQPRIPTVFSLILIPRDRHLGAAALCWTSRGLALSCCGAGRRAIGAIEGLHFGLFRAAGSTAAAAVMAAVLAPARTRTVRPCLHEDNGAVVFRAEVRTVWGAVFRSRSGQLDLKMDERISAKRRRTNAETEQQNVSGGMLKDNAFNFKREKPVPE